MSPETRDPRRLQRRWLGRLDALLLEPGLTPQHREDLLAQRAYWGKAPYATLNELVNCYEPGDDAA